MVRSLIVLVLLLGAAATQSRSGGSPVQKVIELLEDNKVKITNDLAAEEKEMAEYTDFCDKESTEKGYAIKDAVRKLGDLSATIENCDAKIPAYEDSVATLGNEVASKQQQLAEASSLREKERSDFDATEKDLSTSIDQLDRAVTIIKREMSSITAFAQGSGKAESAGLKKLKMAIKVINKLIDSGRIQYSMKDSLEALVQTGTFEGQPQAKQVAYESKSGGIVDKIEEMKEKAEETLTEARNEETKNQQEFSMLEQSLSNGIKVAEEKISDSKSMIGAKTEELNQAKADQTETMAARAADEKYVANLKHECQSSAAGWAGRQESAKAEMGAINKAIEILSEGVRVLLQVSSHSKKRVGNNLAHFETDDDSEASDASTDSDSAVSNGGQVRQRVVDKLKDLSRRVGSYALMQMAGAATSDPFVKIRGLIEDMIAKLLKEAEEEATQKAFCDKEMGASTASKGKKTMTLDKLQSRIDKASARKAELQGAIKMLEEEVATTDAATAEATKIRNEEHETYKKASKDFGDAAAATEKAITVLTDFYDNAALLQVKVTVKVTAPEFGAAKSDAGGAIISILEMSNEDFVKLHAETETGEEEAVEQFEKLINDSKASKAAKMAEVKASKSEIKSLTVSLEQNGEDKTMTSTELDAVLDYIEKLRPQCEEKVMSYAEKKARREAEIAGLKEALEILASEGTALVQTHRSLRHVHFRV